jgi:L-asparaginase
MKKDILILTTGGTIGMKRTQNLGVVPTTEFIEFLNSFPQLTDISNIEVIEYSNLPSPYMTPEIMLDLSQKVDSYLLDYDGIVITHGTDTLEETAYFLDLVTTSRKPIVLTAAMRSGSELGLDGPRNIIDAVRVASHPETVDKGVLVVMNDDIHTARDVLKFDSGTVDAFRSPKYGPIGTIDPDMVIYHRNNYLRESVWTNVIEPKVDLIKAVAGLDETYINASVANGVKAIVIEAFGRGNLPVSILPAIQKAIDVGVLIIIVSRTITGRVLAEYGYEGGGKSLQEMGCILGGDLQGPKARIKLMALFGKYQSAEMVKKFFNQSIL